MFFRNKGVTDSFIRASMLKEIEAWPSRAGIVQMTVGRNYRRLHRCRHNPPFVFIFLSTLYLSFCAYSSQLRCQTYEGGFGGEPWNEASYRVVIFFEPLKRALPLLSSTVSVEVNLCPFSFFYFLTFFLSAKTHFSNCEKQVGTW